jgi:hypothetical protein
VLQNKKLPKATEIIGSKELSLPNKWIDSVKNNIPLLMPCKGQDIDSSNDFYSSKDKHIEIEVHVHQFIIQFVL